MDITSLSYLLFVAVSLLIYWAVPHKFQWLVLLADSIIFYFSIAKAYTIVYLLISVLTTFFAGNYFEKEVSQAKKKAALVVTLVINLGILAVLKYTNLLLGTIDYFSPSNVGRVSWYASLGISFYTLQLIAYLLDTYWGTSNAEKNPVKLFLFASFFPQMISGPISKYNQLSHQLFEEHRFDYVRVTYGLRRIAWGIAKKVIVADRLSGVVAYLFNDPDTFSGLWVLFAGLCFIVNLYFDFSGCMDIVIGVAKCFGIELVENFKAPFLVTTIQEFWRRWHITLGEWLKIYVMYPILSTKAFNRLAKKCKEKFGKAGKKMPSYIAMLIVWLLIGLWHGNSWKYVLGEGLGFWFIIFIGQIGEPVFDKMKAFLHINDKSFGWKCFQIVRTIFLYSMVMIFFRADDLPSGLYMIGKFFSKTHIMGPFRELFAATWGEFGGKWAFMAVAIMGILHIYVDINVASDRCVQDKLVKLPLVLRWVLYLAFLFLIIFEGAFGKSSFIYFGF
ncbi:MAG: hypothetical protein MJ123_07775 [Lachnospiraceae bacterium]|nr:hypothetical protein [Lachnospiraceae bacterium]